MPRVWISVGSNIDRERSVNSALRELHGQFGPLVVSPVYEAVAVGFDGDAFFNLVVGLDTESPPDALHAELRSIETHNGRERNQPGIASRTLDLDLLTYGLGVTQAGGKHLPRDEILRYAFVLGPLADVAPYERHPENGTTYLDLWAGYVGDDRGQLTRLDTPVWLICPPIGAAT